MSDLRCKWAENVDYFAKENKTTSIIEDAEGKFGPAS